MLGTALAFVFIAIVLQLVYSVVGNEPPMENADRIVQIGSSRIYEVRPCMFLPKKSKV